MKKVLRTMSLALVAVLACLVMVGCAPANVEKAEAKMEKAGYTVTAYEDAKDAEGFVGGIVATKISLSEGFDGIFAILFDSKENAEDFAKTFTRNEGKTITAGKWVYAGSEEAVKAFKG